MFIKYNNIFFEIDSPIFTIGSESDNNIVVEDINEKIMIIDINSEILIKKSAQSSIYVNDKKITKDTVLKINDIVSIKKIKFTLCEYKIQSNKMIADVSMDKFIAIIQKIIEEKHQNSASELTLHLVCELLNASAGRIVSESDNGFNNIFAYPKEFKEKNFSQFVIDETKRLNKSLLIKNTTEQNSSNSININEIKSVISAPLNLKKDNIKSAYIYMDKRKDGIEFTENDRDTLSAFIPLIESLINNAIISENQNSIIDQFKKNQINFLYADKIMDEILTLTSKVSKVNIPIFIHGETGSGKEKLAEFIHKKSNRSTKKMVIINSSAIPENLIESELFGYKKGAFTGAVSNKKGLIEEADEGTLFLDEVGDLPLQVQVKLLRVLQEGKILPIGDTKEKNVDVRIISATNKNLQELIKEGKFREDLYYRINGITINIPPLRDRPDDITMFIKFFMEKYSKEFNVSKKLLSKKAEDKLLLYSWPGNVRELEMSIKRALIVSSGNTINENDFDFIENTNNDINYENNNLSLSEIKDNAMKKAITKFLKLYHGNISKAATKLSVDRKSMTRIMTRLNIDANDYRD